jgi:hypothetical protein
MPTVSYRCGCSITTSHTNEPTGVAVCATHYTRVNARTLIAAQADQIRAIHRDSTGQPAPSDDTGEIFDKLDGILKRMRKMAEGAS